MCITSLVPDPILWSVKDPGGVTNIPFNGQQWWIYFCILVLNICKPYLFFLVEDVFTLVDPPGFSMYGKVEKVINPTNKRR